MTSVVLREFGRLTTGPLSSTSIDQASVSQSAFDWLCAESARLSKSGASLVQIESRRWLRLDNFVGVIETPCGTLLEILPKTATAEEDPVKLRRLLRRMLARSLDLPARESASADIQTFEAPLNEWVIRQFLESLDRLVKRGVRFDYHRVQEPQRFLRGRLELARQLRQPPGRQHVFQIEHDIFDADRPENRLLKSALTLSFERTRDPRNWRLANELSSFLAPIPSSHDVPSDFRRWRDTRLLAHYRSARPWCELILNEEVPLSLSGHWRGPSLLFPMEKLFERYVESCLRQHLAPGASLTSQASSQSLCLHLGKPWFQLRPDLLLRSGTQTWILDTKWKLIDRNRASAADKYGLNQADLYQLFAYGQRYMSGKGDLFLIYPRTELFGDELPFFDYSNGLRLWIVPFDLETGCLLTSQELPFSRKAA